MCDMVFSTSSQENGRAWAALGVKILVSHEYAGGAKAFKEALRRGIRAMARGDGFARLGRRSSKLGIVITCKTCSR